MSKVDLSAAEYQPNLFSTKIDSPYPPVYRDIDNFRRILNSAEEYLGKDYEFPTDGKAAYTPSIIGIASEREACAINGPTEIVREIVETAIRKNIKLIGHSVLGTEMRVVETVTGIKPVINDYEDSMLSHYLLNQDLTKAPDKKEDDDSGALGFMGLWTAANMVLDVPNWKMCHKLECSGDICPKHDPIGYCAVDAWASIAAFKQHQQDFKKWNIPPECYENLKQISYICELMHRRGIKIDMAWINKLDRDADKIKEKMFPFEVVGNERKYQLFNPKSSQQILEWFFSRGVNLRDTGIKEIRKHLEDKAKSFGYSLKGEDGKFSLAVLEEAEELPEVLDALYREYEYKSSGKGLAPWFDNKYRNSDDFVFPRFITVGASTTRLSSSRPNFQNIPIRGFGALVRAAIIARSRDFKLLKSDLSQVELRVCLFLSGVDPAIIGKDAFTWLVQEAKGGFDRGAEITNDKPRQVAKSVSHAADYLEGFILLKPIDLQRTNIKNDIKNGALRVYLRKYGAPFDWEYAGHIVAFTGANLAERLLGSKTKENRKKALEIQEDIYFKKFPMIRGWQKQVLDKVQDDGYVRYPTGHVLQLYGRPEDNAKMALAALGQGVASQYIQGVTIRFYNETGYYPLLQVHDDNTWEIPANWSNKQAKEFISLMGEETPRLPGFKSAFKAYVGNRWIERSNDLPEEIREDALVEI